MINITDIKASARPDLPRLAQSAGFRLVRGQSYRCALHEDKTPSATLYTDAIYCFSSNRGFDAVDLFQLATGYSTRKAIKELAACYGITEGINAVACPRYSEETLANAELFRTGLLWRIERALSALKECLWRDDNERSKAAISPLTRQQAGVEKWSTHDAAAAYIEMRASNPLLVEACIEEASDAQSQLASLITVITNLEAMAA